MSAYSKLLERQRDELRARVAELEREATSQINNAFRMAEIYSKVRIPDGVRPCDFVSGLVDRVAELEGKNKFHEEYHSWLQDELDTVLEWNKENNERANAAEAEAAKFREAVAGLDYTALTASLLWLREDGETKEHTTERANRALEKLDALQALAASPAPKPSERDVLRDALSEALSNVYNLTPKEKLPEVEEYINEVWKSLDSPQPSERQAVGDALIAFAVTKWKYGDDISNWCYFCKAEVMESYGVTEDGIFDTTKDVITCDHAQDCLHLRAKALIDERNTEMT